MTPFDFAWEMIQEFETPGNRGMVVDDPDDPGGVTRYGFAQRWHPSIDVRTLTETHAKELFRREYWNRCRCDFLPPRVAIAVADSAFSPEGPLRTIHALQRAVMVTMDGIIGPATIAAVKKENELWVINQFLSWRLVDHANVKSMYRRGLFVRVLRLKDEVAAYSAEEEK